MSLINDMLKDLDGEQPPREATLPPGLTDPKPAPRSLGRLVLPVLAAVAVVYALVVELNIFGLMPEKTPAATAVPPPIAVNPKWLKEPPAANSIPVEKVDLPATAEVAPPPATSAATSAATPGATSSAGTSATAAAPVTEVPAESPVSNATARVEPATPVASSASDAPPAETQPERAAPATDNFAPAPTAIEQLLAAAADAVRQNRLTTPVGDNAYELYRSVLVLAPGNPAAELGIEGIRQTYLGWAENALAQGRSAVAAQYLQRARAVGAPPEVLQSYQDRLATQAVEGAAESVVRVLPEETVLPTDAGAGGTLTPAAAAADETSAADLQREGVVLGEVKALQWIGRGDRVEQTAVVLADLYAAAGATDKLAELQGRLVNRASSAAAYAGAQRALRQRDFTGAAQQLAAVQYTGAAEERRLRTLAGIYQHLQDYARALPLYRQLVSTEGRNVQDWLGLAVSADAEKMPAAAREAYQNVLLLVHPDPRVMHFARQRQQDLSLSSSSR